jgi:hypothetical protein
MTEAKRHESTRSHPLALAFGYLGGGIAWLLHLLASYAIAEFGCARGEPLRFAGITTVAWLLIGVTTVLLLVAVSSALVSARLRPPQRGGEAESAISSRAYLARSGAIMSSVFLLIILAQTVPILFYLESC